MFHYLLSVQTPHQVTILKFWVDVQCVHQWLVVILKLSIISVISSLSIGFSIIIGFLHYLYSWLIRILC